MAVGVDDIFRCVATLFDAEFPQIPGMGQVEEGITNQSLAPVDIGGVGEIVHHACVGDVQPVSGGDGGVDVLGTVLPATVNALRSPIAV